MWFLKKNNKIPVPSLQSPPYLQISHVAITSYGYVWSAICCQNYGGPKDSNILSNQLHLVPELHSTRVMPVSQVAIDEENDQRKNDRQDLGSYGDVVTRQKEESEDTVQDKKKLQGNFPTWDATEIGQAVIFAVLKGVGLKTQREKIITQQEQKGYIF